MSGQADEWTDDALAGPLRVWQRRGGHRYSLDDTLVAWIAARARPEARRVLDLGCGIGSVLLMLAHKLPRAEAIGLEAQEVSFDLAERNVQRNRLAPRVRVARGDLRDDGLVDALCAGRVDLVTATPPYLRPGTATASPDAQRAHARIELRGGVEDYLRAAARVLDTAGLVVACADARHPERVTLGAAAVGLAPVRRVDVVPIASEKPALFTVWSLVRADTPGAHFEHEPNFVARDADGARTPQAHEVRRFFDLPMHDGEPASPRVRARKPHPRPQIF